MMASDGIDRQLSEMLFCCPLASDRAGTAILYCRHFADGKPPDGQSLTNHHPWAPAKLEEDSEERPPSDGSSGLTRGSQSKAIPPMAILALTQSAMARLLTNASRDMSFANPASRPTEVVPVRHGHCTARTATDHTHPFTAVLRHDHRDATPPSGPPPNRHASVSAPLPPRRSSR